MCPMGPRPPEGPADTRGKSCEKSIRDRGEWTDHRVHSRCGCGKCPNTPVGPNYDVVCVVSAPA